MKKILLSSLLCFAIGTQAQTILFENFETGAMPAGWSQTTLASDGGWKFGTYSMFESLNWHTPSHTKFANTNDDLCNCNKSADLLQSPSMNLSTYSKVYVSFDYYYNGFSEKATVEVSTNGGSTWTVLFPLTFNSLNMVEWRSIILDLSTYAGQANVKLAFRYDDNSTHAEGMSLDNVKVYVPATIDMSTDKVRIDTLMPYAHVIPSGNTVIRGTYTNQGTTAINSLTLNYKVDGGAVQSQALTSLNVMPRTTYKYAHSILWNASAGMHTVKAWISNVSDQNISNDTASSTWGVATSVVQKVEALEEFTNDGCGPCASENPSALTFMNANVGKIYQVTYHVNWPDPVDQMYTFNSADMAARRTYYLINGVPSFHMDGFHGWYAATGFNLQGWMDYEKPKNGFFTIAATAFYTGSNISINVNTTSLAPFPTGNMVVQIALVEDKTFITAPGSNGETYFPSVTRKMFPTAAGNSIGTPTSGQPNNFTFNYPYSSSQINVANCRVVVFIQDDDDKYIYQTAAVQVMPVGMEEATKSISYFNVFPNPTSGDASVIFQLQKQENVSLNILNMLGEKVYSAELGMMNEGAQQVNIDTHLLSSGIYFVNLAAGESSFSKKISVIR